MLFHSLNVFWEKHGFNLVLIMTIIFFFGYWLFVTRHKSYGTYSQSYYYDPSSSSIAKSSNHYPQQRRSRRAVTQMSRGEQVCKNYLEYVFERPFQKIRPAFLYNTVTSENLELDLYNEEINLAVEYNGRQHYEYTPYLHNHSRDKFQNQKYRDEKKKELCRLNNVPLIIVPYTVSNENIPSFLRDEIKRLNIKGARKPL